MQGQTLYIGGKLASVSVLGEWRYGALMDALESNGIESVPDDLQRMSLCTGVSSNPYIARASGNPDLTPALQDLGDEIIEDIREACEAFSNPDVYYPGVDDDSIEPVTDEHVDLVIWAMQRELDRELRASDGTSSSTCALPAAPLASLPRHVQRALAERRRLRFKQYGIGRAEWESRKWSLWNVSRDEDWIPRRALRMTPYARSDLRP